MINQIILQRVINIISFVILGLALGIGLCKFCPGFLGWAIGGVG